MTFTKVKNTNIDIVHNKMSNIRLENRLGDFSIHSDFKGDFF